MDCRPSGNLCLLRRRGQNALRLGEGRRRQCIRNYEAPMQAIWFFLVVGVLAYLVMVREKYAPMAKLAS